MTQVVAIAGIMLVRKENTIVISIQHLDGEWQRIATKLIPKGDGCIAIISPQELSA